MAANLILVALLAQSGPTINIGLRDGTVMEDVAALKGRLPRAALRIIGVRLGSDTLDAVQKRLGRTKVLDASPDPHDPIAICYVTRTSRAALYFESLDRESDPSEPRTVWSFTLERPSKTDAACKPLAAGTTLQTDSGLRLEMTAGDVRKLLGKPSLTTDGLLLYVHETADWIGVVEVHLDHGKANRICVGEWKNLRG